MGGGVTVVVLDEERVVVSVLRLWVSCRVAVRVGVAIGVAVLVGGKERVFDFDVVREPEELRSRDLVKDLVAVGVDTLVAVGVGRSVHEKVGVSVRSGLTVSVMKREWVAERRSDSEDDLLGVGGGVTVGVTVELSLVLTLRA